MKLLGKTKVFTYIFYVLAILYLLYTIFQAVTTITYLSSVASSGMYMNVGFADILNAFVGTVGPYIFYTCVLFFCGYAIQLIAGDVVPEDADIEESYHSTKNEEKTEPMISSTTPADEPEIETYSAGVDIGVEDRQPEPASVEDYVSTIADIETESPNEKEFYDDAHSGSTPEAHYNNYQEDYEPDSNIEGELKENDFSDSKTPVEDEKKSIKEALEQEVADVENANGEIVIEDAVELPEEIDEE